MSKPPAKIQNFEKFAGAGVLRLKICGKLQKIPESPPARKKIKKGAAAKALAVFLFCLTLVFQYFHDEKIAREEKAIRPLEEKIGQMLMVGFRGAEVGNGSDIGSAIEELDLGGVDSCLTTTRRQKAGRATLLTGNKQKN